MRKLKKVIIIQAGKNLCDSYAKKFMYTNITCPTIAAAIPDNIDIEIIDMYVQDINFETIDADLVLVTTLTTFAPIAFEVAQKLKKKGITVIVGGVHAVVMPDECQKYFDAVVIGEAELLMEEIFGDFRNDSLKKRYETKEQMDLSKCRIPRYDLLQLHKYSICAIVASKGCAFDCDFCSSRLITGAGFRHKTVEQVINEIKFFQQLHDKDPLIPDVFFFVDSNLYTDRKFLIELLNALIPLDIHHWGLFASVNIANDDEVLELLRKANCQFIQIGFESVNPSSLKSINKKQNNPAKYKEVVEKLANYGVFAYGSFIFGFDDDDTSVFDRTLKEIEDADFITSNYATLTPFPGTRIFERLSNEGRMLHRDWTKYNMEDAVYQPKMMTTVELKSGLKYVRAKSSDPQRLVECLEKFNKLSGKQPKLKANEKIALSLAYVFMFFKLTPRTRYFIRKIISKGNLVDYYQAAHLIANIQNP